jgi:hypothetical protein
MDWCSDVQMEYFAASIRAFSHIQLIILKSENLLCFFVCIPNTFLEPAWQPSESVEYVHVLGVVFLNLSWIRLVGSGIQKTA